MEFPGNPSQKIVSIAVGEAHTLALTGNGSVFSWGRGMFGRLGTGSEADALSPIRIKFGSDDHLVQILGVSAGAYHSLALADDGSVWSWGYNIYGQLGHDGDNSLVPHLVESFPELDSPDSTTDGSKTNTTASLKVSTINAGGMMSLAIDNHGTLWMWGNCPQNISNSEGNFSLVSSYTPIPVREFHGHTVVKVACGHEHIVALVSAEGKVKRDNVVCYSWGNNHHGQLGLGDKEIRFSPAIIEAFNSESPWTVYEVACGAFHTALLTYKKSSSDKLESVCWTFGLGDNGQLGHGTTQSALSPEPVEELPKTVSLLSVGCGLFHTSVVSSTGDVWSWGMEKGLGLCPEASFSRGDAGDAISPRLISSTKFSGPIQIGCGAAHTILVADDGYKLWSWGRGRSGLLGNGMTIDCIDPSVVLWPPVSDLNKEDILDNGKGDDKIVAKDPEQVKEYEIKLFTAMEEMKLMQTKLSTMERYASILHGSIFGKPFDERDIPVSLQKSGTFDIAKEWENMLESSDHGKLVRLEMFYRHMLGDIKDKLMKKRIKEIIKECLDSSATGRE